MYTPGIDPNELAAYFQAQGSPWTPSDALGQRFAGGQQAGPLPGIPGAPGKQPTMKMPLPGGAQPGPGANLMPGGPPSGMDVRPNMAAALPSLAQLAASTAAGGTEAQSPRNGPRIIDGPGGGPGDAVGSNQGSFANMSLNDLHNWITQGVPDHMRQTPSPGYMDINYNFHHTPTADLPNTRLQAINSMFGGQGVTGGVGQLMQQMAQYGPGGLAQRETAAKEQQTNYNTSQSRLGDQLLLNASANGASPEEMGHFMREMSRRGISHSGVQPRTPGATDPPNPANLATADEQASELRQNFNRAVEQNGGVVTPAGRGQVASRNLTGVNWKEAITHFMNSLGPDALSTPAGYAAVRDFVMKEFPQPALNRWFTTRFSPWDTSAHQTSVNRWMTATNQHDPTANVRSTAVNAQSPASTYMAGLIPGGNLPTIIQAILGH